MVDPNHDRNVLMETLSTADQHALVRSYIAARDIAATLTFDQFVTVAHRHFPSFHGFATARVEALPAEKQQRVLLAYVEATEFDPGLTLRGFLGELLELLELPTEPVVPENQLTPAPVEPELPAPVDYKTPVPVLCGNEKQYSLKLEQDSILEFIAIMTNGQSDNSPNGEVLKSVARLTVDDDLYFGIQIASSAQGPYLDVFLTNEEEIVQEHKPIRGIGFFEGEDGLLIEYAGVNYRVTMACE
jgi:hypothetical protein